MFCFSCAWQSWLKHRGPKPRGQPCAGKRRHGASTSASSRPQTSELQCRLAVGGSSASSVTCLRWKCWRNRHGCSLTAHCPTHPCLRIRCMARRKAIYCALCMHLGFLSLKKWGLEECRGHEQKARNNELLHHNENYLTRFSLRFEGILPGYWSDAHDTHKKL